MPKYFRELEDDYRYNLLLANNMVSYLHSPMDRQRVRRWLERLRRYNRTEEQLVVRNDLLYHLTKNLTEGVLRSPFTDNPPAGPLKSVLHMLPEETEEEGEKQKKGKGKGKPGKPEQPWWEEVEPDEAHRQRRPLVYDKSPDGGAFLSAQPVPRCGVFCYLAVVAKPAAAAGKG